MREPKLTVERGKNGESEKFSLESSINRRRFLALAVAFSASPGLVALGQQESSAALKAHRFKMPGADIGGENSLKRHAADARLLFGFAVDPNQLKFNEAYRRLVEQQCTVIVAENAMKWNALAPTPTTYDFTSADDLVAFSERTQIKLRGHTLLHGGSMPGWFASTATPANARGLMENHIRTVVGRYAGRMHSWDVVNEAIQPGTSRPDGLRDTPLLRLVGTDYIEAAFRAARDADPAALLSYNDYDLEWAEAKQSLVLTMLRRLKQRNVPIDAVGIQSHLVVGGTYGQPLMRFIQACREMDLQVFLSEMDVADRNTTADREGQDRAIAATYYNYLSTTLAARNVTTVMTWGVSDAGTWLKSVGPGHGDGSPLRPLLFDERMQPTLAFSAVRDAFDERGRVPVSRTRVPKI
jgi:endo-1,4-beta-xylanase